MSLVVDRYVKHAKDHGTEGVMETAAKVGFEFDQLLELQQKIDQLDSKTRRVGPRWVPAKNHRLTAETRVKRLLGIEETAAA